MVSGTGEIKSCEREWSGVTKHKAGLLYFKL